MFKERFLKMLYGVSLEACTKHFVMLASFCAIISTMHMGLQGFNLALGEIYFVVVSLNLES